MKTHFTNFKTLVFTFAFLFGIQSVFCQSPESEQKPVKYKSKPFVENSLVVLDTLDCDVSNQGVVAPNYMTPATQIECFNQGSGYNCTNGMSGTNYPFELSIVNDNSGNEVYSEMVTVWPGGGPGFVMFPCFTPSQEITTYHGYFNFNTNEEETNYLNNFDTIEFAISEKTFAKENGGTFAIVPDESAWDSSEYRCWAYGNYYYVVNGGPPGENSVQAETVGFSIGNADELEDKKVSIFLYKWVDANLNGNMEPDERTRIAFTIYGVTGDESPDDLIIKPLLYFPDGDAGPVWLESNQAYVLMVEYCAPEDEPNLELMASMEFDYTSMGYWSELVGNPRYAALLGVDEDLESETYSSSGFGQHIVPVVRLNPEEIINNTSNTLTQQGNLRLTPNPAHNFLDVEIDLTELQNKAVIKIYDLNGRVLTERSLENIKYEKINFDLTKFATGTYFLQLVSDAGIRTERFIVQH